MLTQGEGRAAHKVGQVLLGLMGSTLTASILLGLIFENGLDFPITLLPTLSLLTIAAASGVSLYLARRE
jgi:hypothetical protein